MTRFKEKVPIIIFAIVNSIYVHLTDSTDTIIISLLLFISGYAIYKLYDILGMDVDGYVSFDSLKFIATILALCIYCTVATVIATGYISFIPLAVINVISGWVTAYIKYSYFDDEYYYDDDYDDDYDDNDDNDDNDDDDDGYDGYDGYDDNYDDDNY